MLFVFSAVFELLFVLFPAEFVLVIKLVLVTCVSVVVPAFPFVFSTAFVLSSVVVEKGFAFPGL